MARGKEQQKLSQQKKRNKFLRLVLLLTFRKHGVGVILSLYSGFLLSSGISAVDDIWTEFQRFQSCQESFLSGVSQTVAIRYNEATRSVAASTVGKAACIASNTDLCQSAEDAVNGVASIGKDIGSNVVSVFGGRRLTGGCSASPLLKVFLKWTVPSKITFPQVNMTINSNTEDVLASVKRDLRFLKEMAKWTRYAGWILAGLSVIMIIITAARYTMKNKAWKPSKTSYAMHLITFLKVIGAYGLSVVVVMLQAYSTIKFCEVAIQSIEMDTPDCTIDDDCDLSCGMEELTFKNTCQRCNIKLHWWWVETFSTPNIFLAAYAVFTVLALIFENREAHIEKQELFESTAHPNENQKNRSILIELWQRMTSKENHKIVLEKGLESLEGNNLDGPQLPEVEEEEEALPTKPLTKYAASICIYPEKRYTGGLH